MARLVIVSNRLVLPGERADRAGGLAVALRDVLNRRGGLWAGWSGEVTDAPATETRLRLREAGRVTFATFDLGAEDHRDYYAGFANGVIWPLFHYRVGLTSFRRPAYEGYRRVNCQVARELAALLRPDDLIWVHDYHFIPLCAELRRLGVQNRMGFFLHIPFPAPELLITLPVHRALVADLMEYDLIGLQTQEDVRALARYIVEEMGGSVDEAGIARHSGRQSRIGAFPIGIDAKAFVRLAEKAMGRSETIRLADSLAGRALVIGVDRLDYSKGLPQRFEAFQELLSHWPEHRSKVTFMQIAPVSRGEISQYRELRREIDGLAGRINGKFSEFDWTPVRYLNKPIARSVLAGFYRVSRVGLVTPVRDGMNLVAKEFVAAQNPEDPGVLILSRFAGAARELTGALIVNPHDVDEMVGALHGALTMSREERTARWQRMMRLVQTNTLGHWQDGFLKALGAAARPPPPRTAGALGTITGASTGT